METHCEFDEILQVLPTMRYQLRGMLMHSGPYGFGHYTACVSDVTGQWHLCDDRNVRKVNFDYVKRCQAYMLFYEAG